MIKKALSIFYFLFLFSVQGLLATPTLAQEASAAPAAETSISANDTGAALQARIRSIRGLDGVMVEDNAGVITLRGQVLEAEDIQLAEDIAKKQSGVIAVRNEIRKSANVEKRLDLVTDELTSKSINALLFLPLLLIAGFIVWAAHKLGAYFSQRQWLKIRSTNPFLIELVRRVVYLVFLFIGVVTALDLLGAKTLVGAVLGSAGVMGLALGFAFKDIAENYVAGLLLSLRRPFAPRDHVRIDGHEGRVAALTPRDTILMTLDGNDLRIPNAMVFKSVVLNFTRNPNRRFEFEMVIDNDNSIRISQQAALQAMSKVSGVLADPAPSWRVDAYTPDGIKLRFFAWVDQRESDLGKVRTECIRAVKVAFRDAGVAQAQSSIIVKTEHLAVAQAMQQTAAPQSTPTPNCPPDEHCAGEVIDTSVNTEIDDALDEHSEHLADADLLKATDKQTHQKS